MLKKLYKKNGIIIIINNINNEISNKINMFDYLFMNKKDYYIKKGYSY